MSAKYFAVKGQNHETYGFDHRLCEWVGLEQVEQGKFKQVNLLGEEALAAYAEASENNLLVIDGETVTEDAVGTGAVAMAPMRDLKSEEKDKDGKWVKPWEKDKKKEGEAKVDPITGSSDKPIISDETKDEGVDKKKSNLRKPKMAGPIGPHYGESKEQMPDAVAEMITDDPDVFN